MARETFTRFPVLTKIILIGSLVAHPAIGVPVSNVNFNQQVIRTANEVGHTSQPAKNGTLPEPPKLPNADKRRKGKGERFQQFKGTKDIFPKPSYTNYYS